MYRNLIVRERAVDDGEVDCRGSHRNRVEAVHASSLSVSGGGNSAKPGDDAVGQDSAGPVEIKAVKRPRIGIAEAFTNNRQTAYHDLRPMNSHYCVSIESIRQ